MQKTFNVWVKKVTMDNFRICSKFIRIGGPISALTESVDEDIDIGSQVFGCDVSQWLETLGMEEGEVRSFKLTFKEN